MRKIVSGFAASVDGYIAGPQDEYDWILTPPEMDFAAQAKRFDTYLYGRRTFEMVLGMKQLLDKNAHHYVCSNTLTEVPDGFFLVKGDVKKQVLKLKQQPGKDIAVFGGAHLLAALLDLKLVDELVVSLIPVLLGSGKPMVTALQDKVWLRYDSSKTYSNGTVQLTYQVIYKRG